MGAVGAGEVGEALPFLELGLEVDVAFGAETLGELLPVRPVRALDLSIGLGRAGLDVRMPDALVLDVRVELGLELMAVVGADLTNAEREGRDQVVDELDGVGLRVALVDPESADAGRVVDGSVSRAIRRRPSVRSSWLRGPDPTES